jgi:hypothetical protein
VDIVNGVRRAENAGRYAKDKFISNWKEFL